jgi:hypothetical protein
MNLSINAMYLLLYYSDQQIAHIHGIPVGAAKTSWTELFDRALIYDTSSLTPKGKALIEAWQGVRIEEETTWKAVLG